MKLKIAKIIFHSSLKVMKGVLDLGEFKLGRKSDEYRYFKAQVMNFFYNELKDLFKLLTENKVTERCSCKANLRNGYSDCSKCGGSGYENSEIDK